MKILWLPSWYPDRVSPYNGDFIQRHAMAAALYDDIAVIYANKDKEGLVTHHELMEENEKGRLHEYFGYYRPSFTRLPGIGRIMAAIRYELLLKKMVRQYIAQHGLPDLVHVHVGVKVGRVARWIRKCYGLPFVVSEHWTGFLPEANDRFTQLPAHRKATWKKLMSEATDHSAVSQQLLRQLQPYFAGPGRVIPNVVDTGIFTVTNKRKSSETLLHVSNLREQKNPASILAAFARVIKKIPTAQLKMIGGRSAELVAFAEREGIADRVEFFDEVPQEELAIHYQQSAVVILYSSFETFGCVAIEANAAGTPVIASDIPVLREVLGNAPGNYFVPLYEAQLLADTMCKALEKQAWVDHAAIAQEAVARYNFSQVGRQFADWYRLLTGKD